MPIRLLRLELLLLLRGRAVAAGVGLIVVAGLFGLFHGHGVIARQQAVIAHSPAMQDEAHRGILSALPPTAEAGDQLYYLYFHTVREPSVWAPVAIGQRDVQAFNLKVTTRALQEQLYNAEFGNPLLAAFGNFDLAFVFVVLAPLLVIAVTFNVFSGERELGLWDLVRSQPRNPLSVLGVKFALRGLLAWLPLLLLQLVATIVLDLPLDRRWLIVAVATFAHVVFWVVAAIVVSAWQKPSEVNILVLLGLWVACTVLGPALVNVAAAARYPLPEALELTVLARQGYHSAWDQPLPDTMARFYQRYPEWRDVAIPADRYSNGWYYAMQQRGDELARPAAERYRRALVERNRWVAGMSWWFPPAVLQQTLTGIARTDLEAYLDYLDSVAAFHEQVKRHFLPVIFSDLTVGEVDWSAAPRHRFRD
jgi:ABC-2 type transport system permease protein